MSSITTYQIAEACGVSQPTVSRVLGGSTRHSEATRDRVLAAAERLGYRVNTAARTTASGRFHAFALLLSEDQASSLLPAGVLRGIQQAMRERSLNLIVETFSDAALTDPTRVPRLLTQLSSDGLLINYNAHIPTGMLELISRHHLPAVWINSQHTYDCVYPDDLAAARDATVALLERGHRRIAFACFERTSDNPQHYSVEDREGGCWRAMAERGLRPLLVGHAEQRAKGRIVEVMREVLRHPDRPTAILAYSEMDAGASLAAAWLEGLRVPADLSIVTFAERAIDDLGPMLTTMKLPQSIVGRRAVEMLETKIQAPGQSLPPVAVPFTFEQGQTLADVPSA